MWAKVDDQWFAHRKTIGLGLAARGLWITVLSWSCAQRTPMVPASMARFLAGGEDVTDLADELIAAGLWHPAGHDCDACDQPADDAWVIHGWGDYQEKTISEKRAEAGRKGGKRSGETRRSKQTSTSFGSTATTASEATAKQTGVASEARDEAGTHPVPSHPEPVHHHPAREPQPVDNTSAVDNPGGGGGAVDDPSNPALDAIVDQLDDLTRHKLKAEPTANRHKLAVLAHGATVAGWTPSQLADAVTGASLADAGKVSAVLAHRIRDLSDAGPPPRRRTAGSPPTVGTAEFDARAAAQRDLETALLGGAS